MSVDSKHRFPHSPQVAFGGMKATLSDPYLELSSLNAACSSSSLIGGVAGG